MHFGEDNQTTNWLTQRGVPFVYMQNLRFDELVPNWPVVNQGRPDGMAKDEALVEKYAFSMAQGAIFPAPIVAMAADGYEVLDGIQRLCAAFLNDQKLFNGYVVKSDNPSVRASIRVCANSVLNGFSPSLDWTTGRVVDVLYEQHRFSPMDCALWSGLDLRKITAEINSRDGALWMQNHGIDITMKPANQKGFRAVFAELFPIVEREKVSKVLPEIVTAIQSVRANNNEAEMLLRECTDFKPQRGIALADQLKAQFTKVMERPDIKGRMMGKRRLHPVDNVVRAVAAAVTAMTSAVDDDQHSDPEQSAKIVELVIEARDLARKIVPRDHWGKLGYDSKRN
jgi:hypothetical protein